MVRTYSSGRTHSTGRTRSAVRTHASGRTHDSPPLPPPTPPPTTLSMANKVGMNVAGQIYYGSDWVTPDVAWSYYPMVFGAYMQQPLMADHVSGDCWQVADAGAFTLYQKPGTFYTLGNIKVWDAATSTYLAMTVGGVAGTPYLFSNNVTPSDRNVSASSPATYLDNTLPFGNANHLALLGTYNNGVRDTGYPVLQLGQSSSPIAAHTNRRLPAGTYTLFARGTGNVRIAFGAFDGTQPVNTTVAVTNSVPATSTFVTTKELSFVTLNVVYKDGVNPCYDVILCMPDRPGHADNFAANYATNLTSDYYFQFHPDFLTSLYNWNPLRFMDWHFTNSSTVRFWSERVLPGRKLGQTTRGVPYEVSTALANTLVRDGWWCVPHEADDDYVTQQATFLLNNVNSPQKVYAEFSNECWNNSFPQAAYCTARGLMDFHPYKITSLTYSSGTGLCTVTLPAHGLANGNSVSIDGPTEAVYCGTYTIANVTANTFTYTPSGTPSVATASAGPMTFMCAYLASVAQAKVISSISWVVTASSSLITVTTSSAHGFVVGGAVQVAGCSDAGWHGVFGILTVPTSTTMTVAFSTYGFRTLPVMDPSGTTTAAAAPGQSMRLLLVGANSTAGAALNMTATQLKWYGRRTAQVHAIFRTVFAAQLSRLACVVSYQAAGGSSNASILLDQYLSDSGGSLPAGPSYHYATAPYFGSIGGEDAYLTTGWKTISSLSYSAPLVTATTSTAHGFTTGDTILIGNVTDAAYTGVYAVTVTGATTFTYTPVTTPSGSTAAISGMVRMAVPLANAYFREIVSTTLVSTTLTCTSYAHGLSDGETVTLCGTNPAKYYDINRLKFPITVVDVNTFTVQITLGPTAQNPGRCWLLRESVYTQLFADLNAHLNGAVSGWITASATKAAAYSMHPVCYEAGPGIAPLTANNSHTLIVEATACMQRDARMGTAINAYFDLLAAAGFTLVNYFAHCVTAGGSGSWGVFEYQNQPLSQAVKAVAANR